MRRKRNLPWSSGWLGLLSWDSSGTGTKAQGRWDPASVSLLSGCVPGFCSASLPPVLITHRAPHSGFLPGRGSLWFRSPCQTPGRVNLLGPVWARCLPRPYQVWPNVAAPALPWGGDTVLRGMSSGQAYEVCPILAGHTYERQRRAQM